jgi:hypothetical protein
MPAGLVTKREVLKLIDRAPLGVEIAHVTRAFEALTHQAASRHLRTLEQQGLAVREGAYWRITNRGRARLAYWRDTDQRDGQHEDTIEFV